MGEGQNERRNEFALNLQRTLDAPETEKSEDFTSAKTRHRVEQQSVCSYEQFGEFLWNYSIEALFKCRDVTLCNRAVIRNLTRQVRGTNLEKLSRCRRQSAAPGSAIPSLFAAYFLYLSPYSNSRAIRSNAGYENQNPSRRRFATNSSPKSWE